MIPNIFNYATKELSQDALICWLVACGRDARDKLGELGHEFVKALMQSGDRRVMQGSRSIHYGGECTVEHVLCKPKRQYGRNGHYGRIDVYFQARVDGRVVSFVIEDKRHTEMGEDQLKRYRAIVTGDSIREHLVKFVYLKTGYVFDDEREKAESTGYSVFDGEELLAFLTTKGRANLHEIVRQYAEYLTEQVDYRRAALKNWNLDESFVQWEFMVHLGKVLQLSDHGWPARYFNIGGGAWTQYPHWRNRGALYWRLDSWKPLRLMVDTRQAGDSVLARWDGWSRAFESARCKAGLRPARFRSVRRKSGSVVNEGTIGAIDIKTCLQEKDLDCCVARLNQLHQAFRSLSDFS